AVSSRVSRMSIGTRLRSSASTRSAARLKRNAAPRWTSWKPSAARRTNWKLPCRCRRGFFRSGCRRCARWSTPARACSRGVWAGPTTERRLCPRDLLAIYTDGITEAFNDDGDEFGEERLIAALQVHRGLAPTAMVAAVFDEVRRFSPEEQRDDITLIVARCRSG